MNIHRAYKFRFYPTDQQAQLLAQTFGCVRFVYNHILRWRTDAYYDRKEKIGYADANVKLTEIKRNGDFLWLNEVSSVPLQQVLRHQQAALKNFFEGRAKYPTFKKKHSRQSAVFTKTAFKYQDGQLFIAKCKEPLSIKWSRKLPSNPSTITISMDAAGRYFVSFLCKEPARLLPVNKSIVGIDVGLSRLIITDDGKKIANPKHTAKYAAKLAKYQRRLSKKQKGSANRNKARKKVARIHAKIADTRRDNLHKISRKLINENQVICVESLRIKNMVRNPKLAKAINDASWGELVRQLEYKSQWAGRTMVAIDQWFPSSKRCSNCGHVADSMSLDVRSWQCPECNIEHDRDINAAKNIKAAGQAVLAFGEDVSLVSKSDISRPQRIRNPLPKGRGDVNFSKTSEPAEAILSH